MRDEILLGSGFVATKVFVHRWPHDTPEWGSKFKALIDSDVNTNNGTRNVELRDGAVVISGHKFDSLKNVGVSVPFFKKECRVMFEGVTTGMYAHAHLYVKNPDAYLAAFDTITCWMHDCGY